jgi:hypothetical protein
MKVLSSIEYLLKNCIFKFCEGKLSFIDKFNQQIGIEDEEGKIFDGKTFV